MKRLITAAVIGTCGITLAGSTLANGVNTQPKPSQNITYYAGIHGGAAIPNFSKVKTGFNVGAQLGIKYNAFRMEGAFTYINHNISGSNINLEHMMLMANVFYDFNTHSQFVPFVGGGLGWLNVWTNASGSHLPPNKNHFAHQAIAGLAYHITQQLSADVSYHFIGWTGSVGEENLLNAGINYNFG